MIVIFFIGYITKVASLTSERVKKKRIVADKIIYIAFEDLAGPMVAIVGMLIATVISIPVGGPNFLQVTSSNTALSFSCISVAVVIGCITGYYIGKKVTKKF